MSGLLHRVGAVAPIIIVTTLLFGCEQAQPEEETCTDGASQDSTTPCGLNGEGVFLEACQNGAFSITDTCSGTDSCTNGEKKDGTTACGANNDGFLTMDCVEGAWVDSSECNEPPVCEDGDVREGSTPCGLNGEGILHQDCVDNDWVDSDRCTGTDLCTNGSTQSAEPAASCGPDDEGVLARACMAGQWSEESICCTRSPCFANSCRDYKNAAPNAGDGIYLLSPDATTVFEAYCDMTTAGGGWTLLLKTSGGTTFRYQDELWTNTDVLNATALDTEDGDAKYESYLRLPVSELRACFPSFEDYCFQASVGGGTQTALELFSGDAIAFEGFDEQIHGQWSVQPNCRTFGINTPHCFKQARFGFSANQEEDCETNDSAAGLGLGQCNNDSTAMGAGNFCGASGCSEGQTETAFPALLWAR